MPIYEYQCKACSHQFEAMQKLSDAVLLNCPECGKPELQKLISSAGFQLKGNGWYVTDFKDKAKAKSGQEPSVEAKSSKNDGQAADK